MALANFQQIGMMILQNNPKIMNSPQGQQFLKILQSGDVQAGQQMAQNLCQSYGITPEQALAKSMQFFRIS